MRHGPVAKKADMQKYRDGIQSFTTKMRDLIRGGKSKDEVAKALEADYGWAPTGLQMTRGLDGLMVEMKN